MAMQYVNYIKAKSRLSTATKSETPVLSEEDESFLNRLVSDENPPALPPRPEQVGVPNDGAPPIKDAQFAIMDGAQNIPLPETPMELAEEPSMLENSKEAASSSKNPRKGWSWLRRDSRDLRNETAAGLDDIAKGLKDR